MYTNEDYDRLSLNKALTKGDFIGAFEKVNFCIKMIDKGISDINQYAFKINSKQQRENLSEKTRKNNFNNKSFK